MKTTAEAAKELGISTRRVTKLIGSGVLQAQKSGRSWLIDESSIADLIANPRKSGRPKKQAVSEEKPTTQEANFPQNAKQMTGAQALIHALEDAEVELIFGLPGAQVLDIYDALYNSKKLRHILVRHEQAAVHAADGYARVTGKCGTVLVTSGPGSTNTVTGIAAAYMDSVPLVVICGQVPTNVLGSDAFQESDITGITMPVVKHSFLLKDAHDIADTVARAYHIANTGRPGPVVIDVPSNVAQALIDDYEYPAKVQIESYKPTLRGNNKQIKLACQALQKAKCPVVIAGGGTIKAQAAPELRTCINLLNAPITCTMLAKGIFSETDQHYLGVAGVQGSLVANKALDESDVVLAIGTRFADRVTGDTSSFIPHAKLIHIDIDPAEISKNIHADIPIVGDAKIVLQVLNELLANAEKAPSYDAWNEQIAAWKLQESKCQAQLQNKQGGQVENIAGCASEQSASLDVSLQNEVLEAYASSYELELQNGFSQVVDNQDNAAQNVAVRSHIFMRPRYVLETLDQLVQKETSIFTTEVGQHQMWAAHYLKCTRPNSFLSSGGAGVMGYGLPAAMGANLGNPKAQVICIAGDGSLQMNIQEMATITELGLPIKVLLFNNKGLGMVHELQDERFDAHYYATDYSFNPDFCALTKAYRWQAYTAHDPSNLEENMRAWLDCDSAALLEVDISMSERVCE